MTPEKVFTVVFAGLIATSSALQNYTFDEGSLHTVTLPPAVNFTLHNGAIDEATLFSAINATLKKYDSSITLPPFKEIKLSAEIPCVGQATPCGGNVTKIQNASHQLGHETRKRQYNIPLHDDNDLLYDAPVNIGYPYYQTFTMDFDTGSSDIVIPGPRCGTAQGCPHAAKYHETGHKLQNGVTYVYGGGKATGDEYQDSVTVAGLTVRQQELLSVETAPFFSTGDSNYDGLFGMAFTGASGSSATTFMEHLIANGQVSAPEFSFNLGRDFNGNTGANSELILGGRNTTMYRGSITQVPVVNQTAWIVNMASISVNGESAGANINGLAGIDTGTSFIVVPVSALTSIFALIPGAVQIPIASNSSNNLIMYAYPCDTDASHIPTMHLGSGNGAAFSIDPQDFNLGFVDGTFAQSLASKEGTTQSVIQGEGLCLASLLGVQDNVNPDLYVLGTPFLKSWYSVFHYGQKSQGTWEGAYVGFARSVNCQGVGC